LVSHTPKLYRKNTKVNTFFKKRQKKCPPEVRRAFFKRFGESGLFTTGLKVPFGVFLAARLGVAGLGFLAASPRFRRGMVSLFATSLGFARGSRNGNFEAVQLAGAMAFAMIALAATFGRVAVAAAVLLAAIHAVVMRVRTALVAQARVDLMRGKARGEDGDESENP
jgi:hypothetical protein